MRWNLFLLILLPLIELFSAAFAKKYSRLHDILLCFLAVIAVELAISLPISDKIYSIDFGFIQLKFMCDIYSYFFGILVSIVWFLTSLYCCSYTNLNLKRYKIGDFFKYLSLSIFAVLGNGYAADLWTLFIFYTLLILFTAPLIIQRVSKVSLKALRLYLITHIGTSFLLLLPAIILLWYFNGDVDFVSKKHSYLTSHDSFAALLLALFIFGIAKNCVLPFHNWISRSTVAPTPVSALLHSVAAVKSGSVAMIKIAVYIFGLKEIQHLTSSFFTGGWIFYLCGFTAIYAAYRAWKTTDIKKRFAYSTISQLSYILSSIMIATPLAIMGATLHIISHSFCKIALFYIAGIFGTVYRVQRTSDAARLAPHLKFWIALLAFCGASIIGLPFLPGSFGKDDMLISGIQTHHYAVFIFLISGSLINIFYIYPIVKAAFFSKSAVKMKLPSIPLPMRAAIVLAVLLSISISVFISDLTNFFQLYDV
ncbi:MAG: hypothetical protein KGP29_02020 [Proteobacteria bacterium]|nr:hypothetical protein [Pseudomonadota bacterium]